MADPIERLRDELAKKMVSNLRGGVAKMDKYDAESFAREREVVPLKLDKKEKADMACKPKKRSAKNMAVSSASPPGVNGAPTVNVEPVAIPSPLDQLKTLLSPDSASVRLSPETLAHVVANECLSCCSPADRCILCDWLVVNCPGLAQRIQNLYPHYWRVDMCDAKSMSSVPAGYAGSFDFSLDFIRRAKK
ncbi:MAG TPA: hypothetical protein PJ982_10950 [Lacipirellulaceae bacterium]|nr:hypothetical protein [Lacipirellulaceae bacterium]